MEHLAEVLRILDAAMSHDSKRAVDYATLLADKLDSDGQKRQASAVRSRLKKSSVRKFAPASAPTLPIDDATHLATVDVQEWDDETDSPRLVLNPHVEAQLQDFLSNVGNFDLWHSHGVSSPNRLLIHGPPGTGKTSIARQLASAVKLPLLVSRSDTLVSSLLGQTSKNIRQIFDFAQSRPCVLFLDEFDAMAKDRSDSREIGELQRVVIALLQNIDAYPESSVLIAATNHPELLDKAVWRRFGQTIELRTPTTQERELLWRHFLSERLPLSDAAFASVVDLSEGMTPASIQAAASDVLRYSLLTDHEATIAGILRRINRYSNEDAQVFVGDEYQEIRILRDWAPKVFTLRAIAEEFDISQRQVTNALKE